MKSGHHLNQYLMPLDPLIAAGESGRFMQAARQ
jgi:hypothetical protein